MVKKDWLEKEIKKQYEEDLKIIEDLKYKYTDNFDKEVNIFLEENKYIIDNEEELINLKEYLYFMIKLNIKENYDDELDDATLYEVKRKKPPSKDKYKNYFRFLLKEFESYTEEKYQLKKN